MSSGGICFVVKRFSESQRVLLIHLLHVGYAIGCLVAVHLARPFASLVLSIAVTGGNFRFTVVDVDEPILESSPLDYTTGNNTGTTTTTTTTRDDVITGSTFTDDAVTVYDGNATVDARTTVAEDVVALTSPEAGDGIRIPLLYVPSAALCIFFAVAFFAMSIDVCAKTMRAKRKEKKSIRISVDRNSASGGGDPSGSVSVRGDPHRTGDGGGVVDRRNGDRRYEHKTAATANEYVIGYEHTMTDPFSVDDYVIGNRKLTDPRSQNGRVAAAVSRNANVPENVSQENNHGNVHHHNSNNNNCEDKSKVRSTTSAFDGDHLQNVDDRCFPSAGGDTDGNDDGRKRLVVRFRDADENGRKIKKKKKQKHRKRRESRSATSNATWFQDDQPFDVPILMYFYVFFTLSVALQTVIAKYLPVYAERIRPAYHSISASVSSSASDDANTTPVVTATSGGLDATATTMLTVFWSSFVVGRLLAVSLSRLAPPNALMIACLTLQTLSAVVLAVYGARYASLLWPFLVALGACIGPVQPGGLTWANIFLAVGAPKTVAVVYVAVGFGAALGGWLGGFVVDFFDGGGVGCGALMWLATAVGALAVLLYVPVAAKLGARRRHTKAMTANRKPRLTYV